MNIRTLIEKIRSLPPEKQAEVEDFVDFLGRRVLNERPAKMTFPQELLRAINDDREELRRTKGLFDVQPVIRELRETDDK